MKNHNKIGLLTALGAGALLATRAIIRQARSFDLRDKTVLITGGSRGLGLVLAREFSDAGANLVLCARDGQELERAHADLSERGAQNVLTVVCNVTSPEEIEALVQKTLARFGRIDVLVNNAGLIQCAPFAVTEIEDYQAAMQTHFWAALHATRAVLPTMKKQRAGRIVNIASIGGKISVPHLSPYSASKFALVGLSEGLRAELAPDGILVTTVCPGLMRTGSPRNAIFKGRNRAEYSWFKIGDSLPFVSMNAENAAKQIVRATQRGDAEVILSFPAQAAAIFHGLFPGATADLMGLVNRTLPKADGADSIGTQSAKGFESESAWTTSPLVALTDQGARDNNEMG